MQKISRLIPLMHTWTDWAAKLTSKALVILLVIWYAFVAAYTWTINSDFISRDQWHFLLMVDHFMSGTLDWHEFWLSHSEHVKPAYKLLFLLNAKYLNLNIMVETMAGILLLGAASLLMLNQMIKNSNTTPQQTMPRFALLVVGMVLMSFNQWANYAYSLLALGGFGGMLVQLVFFTEFSHLLDRRLSIIQISILVVALLMGVFGFSGARSPAVVGGATIAAFTSFMLSPEARSRILRYATPLLILGFVSIGIYFLLLHSSSSEHSDLVRDLKEVLADPLGAITYISDTMSESMLDMTEADKSVRAPLLSAGLSVFGFLILGWSLWRYFKAEYWRKTWVPLMLISYSSLFVLEVIVGRYGKETFSLHSSSVPRYVFDSHLWIVGAAWIMGLDWVKSPNRVNKHAAIDLVPAVVLMFIFTLEITNLVLAYQMWSFQRNAVTKVMRELREVASGNESVYSLPTWVCPSKPLCKQGFVILKKYQLNVAKGVY